MKVSRKLPKTRMMIRKAAQYSAVLLVSVAMVGGSFVQQAQAMSRIKDVVTVQGIRDNVLIGYGLVVGLSGTGDKLNNSVFTEKSLRSFMDKIGVNVSGEKLNVKNVAAVTVTATLPPFSRSGSRIDVTVSALGDASSLQGGILIVTPLMGADGDVYAVAQGPVTIGGFQAKGKTQTVSKGVATNGYVASGAIVEREIAFDLNSLDKINLALVNPDLMTASRVAQAINDNYEDVNPALVLDSGTVVLSVGKEYKNRVAYLLSEIEHIQVNPDTKAKIIIDEASGTIVMNENVRVDTVAIAQGNLVITVREQPVVSQPDPLSDGETVEAVQTSIDVAGKETNLTMLNGGASLNDLVAGLNALGVGPRDLITILQNIKTAGALHAEIVTR